MASEVDRLVAYALHQATVAGDHVGVMIHEIVAVSGRERALGDGHADRSGEPLAKRAGGRLDAESVTVFWMARSLGAELTEALDLVDRHVGVTGQMEQRVEQHRSVAGREDEAVAIRPMGDGGIEFEE